ncbi:MAG: class I SAM-dependent methyltransferase [bacterium]
MEVGAGTCWAIQQFAERGCKCVALDFLKHNKLEMADYWFEEKNLYFERILADMDKSGFRESSFDIVYGLASFMYSKNITDTLHEMNRILKFGGKIILISEPVIGLCRSVTHRKHGSGWAYSIFEWDRYIRDAGFRVTKRFFADSIKMRFKNPEMITRKNRWYYHAVKLLNPLWETKFLKSITPDNFSWLYSVFMPLPLMIVAVKEK